MVVSQHVSSWFRDIQKTSKAETIEISSKKFLKSLMWIVVLGNLYSSAFEIHVKMIEHKRIAALITIGIYK